MIDKITETLKKASDAGVNCILSPKDADTLYKYITGVETNQDVHESDTQDKIEWPEINIGPKGNKLSIKKLFGGKK